MYSTAQSHQPVADSRRTPTALRTRSSHRYAIVGTLLALALCLASVAHGQGQTIRSGHGGHWYDPARSGEGWVLELLGDDSALLYWFTYDEDGHQRWLTAVGQTEQGDDGDYIDFPTLVVTRGGRFGPGFDPNQVVREPVGSASLRFADCDHGQFSYQAFGQAQTFQVVRLAHTMGTACESANGVPGRESTARAGHSGSWYDPSHNGEGYSLQWLDPRRALITWYSYDTEGRQYWMLGVGELDQAGRLHFPELHATRGAGFGAGFDPDDVERFAWGTLTVDVDCDSGTADYASVLAPFGSGGFDLQRLTHLRGVGCPWQQPKLTDIYDFDYQDIPIDPGTVFVPNRIQARRIDNDGTIVGNVIVDGRSEVVRWSPVSSQWQQLGTAGLFDGAFMPPGGDWIVATQLPNANGFSTPLRWRDASGWSVLGGMSFANSFVDGMSMDGRHLVGRGRHSSLQRDWAWVWDEVNGQFTLPDGDGLPGMPLGVSNDGRTAIGVGLRQVGDIPRRRALIWMDRQPAQLMLDAYGVELAIPAYCNADCSIVFGFDQSIVDDQHPHTREPWYWKGPGVSGYLGKAEGNVLGYYAPYAVRHVAPDGSLAVGVYAVDELGHADGWIWTQRTGLVPVARLLHDLGVTAAWTDRAANSISADGSRILLAGYVVPEIGLHTRAAVLRLQPRSGTW